MRSFKKPLKAEEERYYLKMYRDGDEKAKEKLIEHNLRLVAHIDDDSPGEKDFAGSFAV